MVGVPVMFDQITPPGYQSIGQDLESHGWERGWSNRSSNFVHRSSEVDTSRDPRGSKETGRRRGKPAYKRGRRA